MAWTVRAGLVAVLGCAACGPGAGDGPRVVVRDSAGVEVVDNRRPEWSGGRGWRVGPEPLLRIGVVDGAPWAMLGGVTGVVRLDDGTVVVADGSSQEVRYFGRTGEHRATAGGPGAGPGEFTGLAELGPAPGGGVWAYDFSLRRITWLDGEGAVVAVGTLGPEPPVLSAVGALADGSLVLKQLWGARRVASARETGPRRDPVAWVRFDRESSSLDTVAVSPGREVHVLEEDGRGVMSTPPFARNAVGATLGDRVVVGTQIAFALEEYDASGALRRRIRLPPGDLTVGPAEVASWIEARVAAVEPDRRPGTRSMLEAVPAPTARPAYGVVRGDRTGHVWVGEYVPDGSPSPRWTVLDPSGRWLGTVSVPAGFEPMDIGSAWIAGVEKDTLDVEHVVVYPVDRDG